MEEEDKRSCEFDETSKTLEDRFMMELGYSALRFLTSPNPNISFVPLSVITQSSLVQNLVTISFGAMQCIFVFTFLSIQPPDKKIPVARKIPTRGS
jgi:hypothetical protein